jgi:hypothetical protein
VAIYWVGQDGNAYYKGDDGNVRNYGAPDTGSDDSNLRIYNEVHGNLNLPATRIADPNPGTQETTSSTASAPTGGGGTSGTGKILNRAGIDNTQRTIDEIPGLLEAALAAEKTRYGNTIRQFGQEEAGQRKSYDTSTITNQQNYDANFMDSIRAGMKGVAGLLSLLRGTGAAGGTAEDIARDTVGGVTSQDIRGGADTQQENQVALDSSLGNFLTELQRKRALNEDAFENNQRAVRRDSNTQLQDLFGKMAGFYGDYGDEASANNWMNRAGDLTPRIAADSRTRVSEYDTAPVAVQAPQLTAFKGPSSPSVVTAPGGQVGSGIFTMSDPRRRREQAPVGV